MEALQALQAEAAALAPKKKESGGEVATRSSRKATSGTGGER
jgi:hypothetical protein